MSPAWIRRSIHILRTRKSLPGPLLNTPILDVLSATRASRLAILELKTVEHPVFLMQGAKYWLRVKRHLELENFPSLRFFPWPPASTRLSCI
jgi:hypothetical protein